MVYCSTQCTEEVWHASSNACIPGGARDKINSDDPLPVVPSILSIKLASCLDSYLLWHSAVQAISCHRLAREPPGM